MKWWEGYSASNQTLWSSEILIFNTEHHDQPSSDRILSYFNPSLLSDLPQFNCNSTLPPVPRVHKWIFIRRDPHRNSAHISCASNPGHVGKQHSKNFGVVKIEADENKLQTFCNSESCSSAKCGSLKIQTASAKHNKAHNLQNQKPLNVSISKSAIRLCNI